MGRLLLTLFLINLVPVASVVLFGWSATSLLLVYWGENLIVGAITLAKILAAGVSKGRPIGTLGYAAFFIVHYGLFCAVHASLIFALTDPAGEPDLRVLPALVAARIAADPVLFFNLALLGAFHVFKFVAFWLRPGTWRNADPRVVMFTPYGRIVVVHIALLGGGLIAVQFGQPVIVVAALALFKSFLEAATQAAGDDMEQAGKGLLAKRT